MKEKKKLDVILVTRCHCHRTWDTYTRKEQLPEKIDIPLVSDMVDLCKNYKANVRSFGYTGYDKVNQAYMYMEI